MSEIRKDFRFLPFTTAIVKKGWTVDRARINRKDEVFHSEKELSYRTDIRNITEFGRANVPHSSLFYGSVQSDSIEHPRLVNLLETEEVFRSGGHEDAELTYTVGKWRVKKDFEVAQIISSEEVRNKIPWVKTAYDFHMANMSKEHPNSIDYLKRVLEFFSKEFSKKTINNHNDYMLSAAYSELAFFKGLNGVAYPSVRTEFEGLNVAFPINVVNEYLELEIAGMFTVKKKGKVSLIDNAKIAKDLGPMNSKFNWQDSPSLSEEQINEILIEKNA